MDHIDTIKEIFDLTIDHQRYVAPYDQTRWITLSSFFFLIPGVYGYQNEQYMMSFTLFLTSLCSVNFWRHANYSWRRIMDRIYAKISFIICFVNGIRYSTLNLIIVSELLAFFAFMYCFYMSNKYNALHNNIWWKYHLTFHLLAAYVQIIIVKSMIDYENNLKIC